MAAALKLDRGVELVEIAHRMNVVGLPRQFIAEAIETAFHFEGVYDLAASLDGWTT